MSDVNIGKLSEYIDHILLTMNSTSGDVKKLCVEALEEGFHAVCINPIHVKTAKTLLKNGGVKVAAVVGFSLGQTFMEVKVKEAETCVENGADELDIVSNTSLILEERYHGFEEELRRVINSVKKLREEVVVKVVIEMCYLNRSQVKNAVNGVVRAGADFIKTSTGRGLRGVTVEDVKLLKSILPRRVKIKAAGGVRRLDQAISLIKDGADRLGMSSAMEIMNELSF